MSLYENYDDVLNQLRAAGLEVESIEVGRLRRCRVTDDREKRGWYALHEMRLDSGATVLVGAFGVWRGNDKGAQKVQLRKVDLTREQKDAIKARIAADKKREQARREREAERAAARARAMWARLSEAGSCEYLTRKHIAGHGVRYTARGNMAIPLLDAAGQIHGLQIIYGNPEDKQRKQRDKDFWPHGMNPVGRFFLLGLPTWIVLVAEGYATAATLHEITGLPVAVAFNAGNLAPVARALRKRYRALRILVCADDDFATPGNPGCTSAAAAALEVGGAWLAPAFAEDPLRAEVAAQLDFAAEPAAFRQQRAALLNGRQKLTDFNDLAHWPQGGPHLVKAQLDAKLAELGWAPGTARRPPTDAGGGAASRAALRAILTTDELIERFAIVYGHGGTAFDHREHQLVALSDVRDACTHKETHRRWMEYPDKQIVRIDEVGFDPAGQDAQIRCNLWGGWPTMPRPGACERLLELLEYLCSQEDKPREVYQWLLRWVAYPIQNPGAKMKTALVLHGPQGVGKNLFFESVMAIYGQYGRIVGQDAIEDKFNADWVSKKLFLIADEVVARQELFHTKNRLKGLITSDWIRINPKNIAGYYERNHANIVFLSNETQPLVLERDDRRYAVIWTPPQLSQTFIDETVAELKAGGIAALHHHLLHEVNLDDFGPHTRPPPTRSKTDLIELSMDSTERFAIDWLAEKIEHIPKLPCKSQDLYAFYREWCGRAGYSRYAPEAKFLAEIEKRGGIRKGQARYLNGSGTKNARFVFPPGIEQPVDKTQPIWLSECITEFRSGVSSWKEDRMEM